MHLLPSPPPPIQSLTETIKRLSYSGHLTQCSAAFSRLRHLLPSSYDHQLLVSPVSSLLYCSLSLRSLRSLLQLHSLLLSLGLHLHPSFLPSLVLHYSSCSLLSLARRSLLGSLHTRSWNALISSYLSSHFPSNALLAFRDMLATGVRPDLFTYPSVLKACAQNKDLDLGRTIHALYLDSSEVESPSNLFVSNAIVDMYAKCGELGAARKVFDEMPDRDAVSWNVMVSGYAGKDMWREAMEVFEMMRRGESKGAESSCTTWNVIAQIKLRMGSAWEALGLVSEMVWRGVGMDLACAVVGLNACSQVGELRPGKEMHGVAIRNGWDGSERVTSVLIALYSRCKDTERAYLVFRRASSRSLIAWNSMVSGFAINDQAEEASMVFRELVWSGNEPNYITVVTLSSLCARVSNLQHGRELHCFTTKNGFEHYRLLWNSLVDMYAKSGRISVARSVFNMMTDRDQVSYTSLISGYGVQGEGMKALQLYNEMISSGIEPDNMAVVAVLSACSHAGLVSEGQNVFDNMWKHRIQPRMEHYSCLVDLYARAGILEEAENILLRMPFRPNAAIWAALLNACLVHKNTEIGERAAKRLLAMNTQNSGHYVLIANMYAAVGCWEELAKVRVMMRDRGVRKPPGVAWVDIGKGFQMFSAADRSSPVQQEIYTALEMLMEQMRDAGCVDDAM